MGCWQIHERRNDEAVLRADLYEMRKAINDYFAQEKRYPAHLKDLVPHYLRKIPPDPITKSVSTWIEVHENGGIVDVRSGAPGKALDGTPYRDL